MKLKHNQNEYPIISSDDVYMTGETTGKKLSNVINSHEKDINDLKKYTKWLYKYGGTGSKYGGGGEGGGGGSTSTLGATVRLNGVTMNPNKDQQLVLNNEKTVSISGELSNAISTNHYYISIKKGSTYITKSISKNNVRYDEITSDSWYQFNYPATSIDDNTQFTILITSTGTENKTISYTVNVIKEAYSFALSFADNNHKQIISTDNDLWIDGSASVRDTGLSLNINYNVIAENPIEYEIVGDDVVNMFDCGDNISYKGLLNENAIRKESVYIPFKESFLNNDDSIGYYSITIGFTIKEAGQALQTIYKQISFNLIPQNSYFFKVMPVNNKQKFYKYNEANLNDINSTYNEYELLYAAYVKLNINNETLDNKSEVINIIRTKYNSEILDSITDENLKEELQNAVTVFENNTYVYPAGNIKFYVTAYFGTDTASTIPIEAELNGEKVSIGMTQIELRSKESISFNISQSGVYTFSFYCPQDISKKITYYMYVYDKVTEINWYADGTILQAQNYWRTGSVTPLFKKYNNVYNIQKYSNDTGKTNIITLNNEGASVDNIGYPQSVNDIMVSLGIQYSSNNTSIKDPIIEILAKTNIENDSTNTNHIKIYQNKIVTNGEEIPIFLPKESLYNVKDNSKYHLLTIYKRFIYNKDDKDYYEICIYLDGCLENASDTFTSNNSPLISINLLPGNFAINLAEISYFMHNDNENEEGIKEYNLPRVSSDGTINNISYLDDIAISEYFYKYAGINYNVEDVPAYETVKKTIKQLRGFGEVSNGMIKVSDSSIINDIAKEGTVPVMLFEHSDITKGEFIKFYTSSKGAENAGNHLPLDSLKYSSGHSDLIDIQMPSIPGQGNLDKLWYIELQGSSTLLNFAKNLNIGIEQKIGGYMILFTPNFKYVNFADTKTTTEDKKKAKNSYLPETKFTLKTDQVDSTHSNNTAIGAFVNENTTPFISSTSNNYSNYIKNCLLGFPVLVFMKVNEYTAEGEAHNESYYFLGIMNFNLGRDSYFNMGYYDTEVLSQSQCNNELTQLDGSTFKTIYISLNDNTATELPIRSDVMVAEIQGGDPHFDFSQAKKSVLFPNDSNDTHVMFGDFVPRYTYGASARDLKMQAHLRRLVENISLSGGYLFEMIGKHFGEYSKGYNAYINDGVNKSIYNSANQVPNYMIQYERIPGKGDKGEPLYSISSDGFRPIRTLDQKLDDLRNLIISYTDDQGIDHTPILDYKSVSEYYVVCMAFGLVDSVMKNLNVKTWNASDNITDASIMGKWFTAFYDMDTAFGRNNGGTATSYFAFSDYWFNTSQALSVATIYRDFFPKADETFSSESVKNIGYDVPSSYLFAIAKYAPMAFTGAGTELDLFDTLRQHTPQNIWARWRTVNNDPLTIGKLGSTGLSELRNADYFIDKYFVRNLDEIPEQIWNMNYRLKYLKRIKEDSTLTNGDLYTWDTTSGSYELTLNKRPFHGKGINELREWLSGRFHILDAYFNIEGYGKNSQYPILKLNYNGTEIDNTLNPDNRYSITDPQSGETYTFWTDNLKPNRLEGGEYDWVYSGYFDNTPDDTIQSLYTNEDIILLSDIFSASRQGNKYDNNIYLTFKSKEYTPVLVVNAMGASAKYLIENPNNKYSLNVNKTGTTNSLFGGAANWTWIDNLNSLIVDEKIYIKSNNLESIVLSQGKCSKYTLLTPALKEVSITEPINDEGNYTEFSGNLTFSVDSGNDNYPCLDKVDISRTSINLTIKAEGVKTVNLSKITSQNISLIDCNNLSTVNLSGAQIDNCEILPAWSNDISINSSKIHKLKIGAKNTNAPQRTFKLDDDQYIETLELSNFTHIEITNCSKLNNLIINNVEDVVSLKITRCNYSGSATEEHKLFNITTVSNEGSITNDDTTYEFPLQYFTNLEEISLQGTYGIKQLDFSNCKGVEYNGYHGINLLESAFANTDVTTIITDNVNDQVLFIKGPSIFSNCGYTYGNNKLYIPKTTTSLSNMFNYSYSNITANVVNGKTITNLMVSSILGNVSIPDYQPTIYEDQSKIVDISNMFYGQSNIFVTNSVSQHEYESNLRHLRLSNFTGVRNIAGIYGMCNIRTIDSSLFGTDDKYLGMDLDDNLKINISSFITTANVNCEIHTFKYVINRVDSLIAAENWSLTLSLFEGDNYGDRSQFNLQEFFKSYNSETHTLELKPLSKLTEFVGFNIANKINWTDAFAYDDNGTKKFLFPNLSRVVGSFNRTLETTDKSVLMVFNENLEEWGLYLCDHQLNVKNSFNFSLATPIDYTKIVNLNVYNGLVPVTASEFKMEKFITERDFINVLKTINSNNISNLDYKFQYLTILKNDSSDNTFNTHDESVIEPYQFTSCKYTFDNMKFKVNKEDENIIPIVLTSNSLKYFTNCRYWDYAFSNIVMYQNLPLNLFNKHTENTDYTPNNYKKDIQSIEGTFSNITIASSNTYFRHEDYDDICITEDGIKKLNVEKYNNGDVLDGSYHSEIYVTGLHPSNITIDNPKSKNILIDGEKQVYGANITNHLILPFDIFFGCSQTANIKNCFMNSDFEGILPSLLMANNQLSALNQTFKNLLVVPNRIYNTYGRDYIYMETELLNGAEGKLDEAVRAYLHIDENSLNDNKDWFQRHKTYVFVPRGFTTNTTLVEAFNFKVILPLSVANSPSQGIENAHNSLYEHYFIFTNTSIPNGSLINFSNSMPGNGQYVWGSSIGDSKFELYNININHPNNDGLTNVPSILDLRAYHNIHYSLMLIEPTGDNQNFEEEDTEALTYKITGLLYTDNSDPLKYGISHKHYGMTLTENLKQNKLSNFMNSLSFVFMFSNIFKDDTTINIQNSETGTYGTIFNNIDFINRYCKLPEMQTQYSNAISVNMQRIPLKMSIWNTVNQQSYNHYSYSATGITLFTQENGETYPIYGV